MCGPSRIQVLHLSAYFRPKLLYFSFNRMNTITVADTMFSEPSRPIQQTASDIPDSSGWSASLYNKHTPFVYSPAFTAPVLELLSAQPGERIIDFGCGSGEVTLEIKKLVDGATGGLVVGLDFSESMASYIRAIRIWTKRFSDHSSQSKWARRCVYS